MKRAILICACLLTWVFFFLSQGWAACPEAPVDAGECDTLHVDIDPSDQEPPGAPPYFVRFPIRVTHDIVDPMVDSLAGFMIALCYTHSNPAAYCSLSDHWNSTRLYPEPGLDRSIFRHLDGETNWMMWLAEHSSVLPWDTIILDLDGSSHFWMALSPTGTQDQRFWEGSRILLATMTFKMEDTATICIDSCIWPPSDRLLFVNSVAQTYIPRHYLPICERVGPQPNPPLFTECPPGVSHDENGTFQSAQFQVTDVEGQVVAVSAEFVGSGVTDVNVVYTSAPPMATVAGYVEYTVSDHCQAGGALTITAYDDVGWPGRCEFDAELINDPPALAFPDTTFAVAHVARFFRVLAIDPNDDAVETSFDGLWYEPDSSQAPVNPPSYVGGNPGFFSWEPTETEQGPWICSFTAADVCGAEDTRQMTILVGVLFCGDVNADGLLEIGDVVMLLGWLYRHGPPPDPLCRGDANCDGVVDLSDVIRILNYLYKWGPAPCFDCCADGF